MKKFFTDTFDLFLLGIEIILCVDMALITRREIIDLLQQWYQSSKGEEEVFDWVSMKLSDEPVSYDDNEADGNSASKMVMTSLAKMDNLLIVAEDAPIYIDLLQTPVGKFTQGFAQFAASIQAIDKTKRRHQLATTHFYGKYC